VSGRDLALCVISGGTVLAVALAAVERARIGRGASQWWDVLVVAFGLYFGLLSVTGWIWFLVSAVAR
jgi:hypothetical protein